MFGRPIDEASLAKDAESAASDNCALWYDAIASTLSDTPSTAQ